jgi:antirestriction protein
MSTTMTSPAQQLQQEIEESGRMDSRPIEFYQELIDYGIESLEQFEDSYQGQYQSGADFAEQLCDDCGYLGSNQGIPDFILNHIDWETVWSNELRFDYFAIKVGYVYEFFHNF